MNSNCDEIYYGIRDPDGHINHTTIATMQEESIEIWIKQEQAMNVLYNASRTIHGKATECCQSWEGYEAQGYSVVPLRIIEA